MGSPYQGMPQYGQQPQQYGQQPYGQPQQWGPPAPPPPPPPKKNKTWLWLTPLVVLAVAAAVVVVLVKNNGSGSDTAGGGTGGVGEETRTPQPKDRDVAAVVAALRGIDPCALTDVNVAHQRDRPEATTFATGPHSCYLSPTASYSPGDVGLTVKVGQASDQLLRYFGAPVTVGDAKTYRYATTDSTSSCRFVVPVSFELVIEFSEDLVSGSTDVCPAVQQYVEAAVAKLADPGKLPRAERPFAAWDGCSLLTEAVPDVTRTYRLKTPVGGKDPLASCETNAKEGGDVGPGIELYYDTPPDPAGQASTVGGKTVYLETLGDHCRATWDQGPSGTQNQWYASTKVEVSDKDCAAAGALAGKVMELAAKKPSDTKPATELLYGPDDNDTGARGACVDLGVTGAMADCEPYQKVTLPKSADEIMSAAASNRNVQCAVFNDAVVARFGKEFVPVTWGAHCFFVDPKHDVMIQVNVNPVDAPGAYGQGGVYADRQETTIAGKAAVTFFDTSKRTFDIYLSPGNDLSARGNLHFSVEAMGGRGADMQDVTTPLPQEPVAKATEVMTAAVEKYFR